MSRHPVAAQTDVTVTQGGLKKEPRAGEITQREIRKQNLKTLYFPLLKALIDSWFTTPKSFVAYMF